MKKQMRFLVLFVGMCFTMLSCADSGDNSDSDSVECDSSNQTCQALLDFSGTWSFEYNNGVKNYTVTTLYLLDGKYSLQNSNNTICIFWSESDDMDDYAMSVTGTKDYLFKFDINDAKSEILGTATEFSPYASYSLSGQKQ